jgi:outer membrane lipoprotein-sorting protein
MKKIMFLLSLSFVLAAPAPAQTLSADQILDRIDENAIAGNRISVTEMIIHSRRATRTLKLKSWVQGEDKAFTEFLEPARERGTKMLKLGDQLWTYSPDADRTISISGHMLRQSVMGSDLSYEDMLEDRKLRQVYEATVVGEETIIDRPCWVLELKASAEDVAYYSRKIWVDRERFVLLREHRFAKSGRLLKTLEVKSVIRAQNRWVQNDAVFKDALKAGDGTEFIIQSIEFEAAIPESLFTKAFLRKEPAP